MSEDNCYICHENGGVYVKRVRMKNVQRKLIPVV